MNEPMNLPARLSYRGRSVLLKYHKFNSGLGEHPPNSLSALKSLLDSEVEVVEFDVGRMADGEYALLHDTRLDRETDGVGRLRNIGVRELKALRLRESDEAPATLGEVAELLASRKGQLKVQVDLKEERPLDDSDARSFLAALEPLRGNPSLRVVVGCIADWNLRILRRLDANVIVGFDPSLYLHAPLEEPLFPLPLRVNAYGYLDDHPLGYRRVMSVERYLVDRLDALLHQVPGAVEFYLHKGFVVRAIQDGLNPVEFIHRSHPGAIVDVWTFNPSEGVLPTELLSSLAAGADQVTTDSAVQLATLVESVSSDARS